MPLFGDTNNDNAVDIGDLLFHDSFLRKGIETAAFSKGRFRTLTVDLKGEKWVL
jgi:hypothetical protein